jgi:hypothetical protein
MFEYIQQIPKISTIIPSRMSILRTISLLKIIGTILDPVAG